MNCFYVYEHIRKDNGTVFYVGKGSRRRAFDTQNRNQNWHNIAKNYGFDVRFVVNNIDEDFAMLIECELIHKLKLIGVSLTNKTSGGQGLTGFKHSEETKQRIRQKKIGITGRKHTKETKEKIRIANTGVVFSEERKKKISDKAKGRKMPSHVRALLNSKNKSFRHTAETKEHLRQVNLGRLHSQETIRKMRLLPKLTCLHCKGAYRAGNYALWHGNNCKLKGITA